MPYQTTVGAQVYRFADLKTLLAKASPARSGDYLAGSPPPPMKNAWPPSWPWPRCRSSASSTRR